MKINMRPVHPGEILREDFMRPLRRLTEIMVSTPRALLSHQCKARFAGNGNVLAKKRNAAVMAQGGPNVNIISVSLLKLSANTLAKALHVPAGRINDIVLERRGITPDTALRLARYFGGDARSWLNLQAEYDLKLAMEEKGSTIEHEVEPRVA